MNRLFLIDGHALVFKMYYAFLGRPMVNSKGVDTSIIYGFTKYLLELVRKESPTHLAVSFDLPGGTFRNRLFPEYKANRPPTPQLVIDALEPLCDIVKALGIPVVTKQDFEADDVIGTMACTFAADGFDVYMVTPDKDYGQLVGDHVFQFKPGGGRGDDIILDAAGICAKWGIDSPLQVIDMLTICGDTADNVPGVKGVGQVGAAKMMRKFGSLDAIYGHLGELAPRQRQMFEDARDHIELSRELVTIRTDVPLDVTAADMELRMSLSPEAEALFDLYEMPSLKRLLSGRGPVPVGAPCTGFAPAAASPAAPPAGKVSLPENAVVGYDLKSRIKALEAGGGELKGKLYDVALMHYVLNPEASHSLEDMARSYLGIELGGGAGGGGKLSLFDDDAAAGAAVDESEREEAVWKLAAVLYSELAANPALLKLYEEVEEPLIRVLSRMELCGVRVDVDSLKEFADHLRIAMFEQEALVRSLASDPGLNVSSPKQIGEVIFEKLKLDPTAKKPRKGSWPTDETTLRELADRSPIIDAILEYRGLRKLLNTYIEPFPSFISPADGRVHTTFNQALTSTGRLSSSNPNLQNIPIRTEQGREIRKAFVPGIPGSVIMSADYSQIELRIMAHLCGDEHLRAAFLNGEDVHAATAAKIFGVSVGQVSAEQRRMAKTVNFGIMYGISAFGLSQRLNCPRSQAKQLIEDYFASFPSIRNFIDSTLSSARRDGYVQTLFGRRRYLPDINHPNGNIRALSERNAVNAPIQGTAADIIKLAMSGVDNELRARGLKSRMVLQVHDELVLEVPEAEIETVKKILTDKMEGVMELAVPLTVECNYGKNWLEAH